MTDPNQKSWHVLVKTRCGNVSLIKNLTRADAVKVRDILDPYRNINITSGSFSYCRDDDVTGLEIICPDEGCQ
jgi:hypothetical protein